MRRLLPWVGVMASGVLALGSVAALGVAMLEQGAAREALLGSVRAREAELSVVKAQRELSGTDVSDALASIRSANEAAERVAALTGRLVESLEVTLEETGRSVEASREAAAGTVQARRETDLAAELLAAIAGYQGSAAGSADRTNAALRRILRALRETNRELSGEGFPR